MLISSYQTETLIPDFTLTVISITSNAAANGIATNSFTVRLTTGDELVDNASIFFSVTGSAFFVPGGLNQTNAITNNQGEATVFFANTQTQSVTVTAIYGSDQVSRDSLFGPPFSDTQLELSDETLTFNIEAGSGNPHIIRYTLFNPASLGVPGRIIIYSVIAGVATINPPWDTTDTNGNTLLNVTSPIPGPVVVRAELQSAPAVVHTQTTLTFIASLITQRITVWVEVGTALANGVSQNRLRYQVKRQDTNAPVANVQILVSATGSAIVTPLATQTDINGYLTVTLVNRTVELVTVTAELTSGFAVPNQTQVRFV